MALYTLPVGLNGEGVRLVQLLTIPNALPAIRVRAEDGQQRRGGQGQHAPYTTSAPEGRGVTVRAKGSGYVCVWNNERDGMREHGTTYTHIHESTPIPIPIPIHHISHLAKLMGPWSGLHNLALVATSWMFALPMKFLVSFKSNSAMTNWFATTVIWSSGTRCAIHIALAPVSSGIMWNMKVSSLSATVSASPASSWAV